MVLPMFNEAIAKLRLTMPPGHREFLVVTHGMDK